MEQEQGVGQPNEDARYKQFAEGRKQFAAEIGERTLDVAKEGKTAKEGDLESQHQYLEQHQQKMEKLRDDIDAKKRNVITKIMNFKQLKELEKELNREQTIVQKYEEEQKWRAEMIGYYDRIIEEEEQMGMLMEEAYADNETFDAEKKAEIAEEAKGRSVMERAKKHNVFFVSDIITAGQASANNRAVRTEGMDFDEQLDIVLGLEPTIAVSTLSPDSKNRTFGRGAWGVLISGGRITGGEPGDAGSWATGLRSRVFHSKESTTVKGIDEAIEGRYDGKMGDGGYNELAVEQPEVAGVYFKLETKDLPEDLQTGKNITLPRQFGDAWWEQIGKVMNTGAPMFVIERDNNTVRMVYDIDMEKRSFKVTPTYAPENVVNMPGIYKQHLDAQHKRVSITKIFDKTAHLLTEEERAQHEREKGKGDTSNFINVY